MTLQTLQILEPQKWLFEGPIYPAMEVQMLPLGPMVLKAKKSVITETIYLFKHQS